MTYQTILLHLDEPDRARGMLEAGCALARKFESHLTGLAVYVPVVLAAGATASYGPEIIAAHREEWEREAAGMEEKFRQACANQSFTFEWRIVDGGYQPMAATVAQQCGTADIVVVSQGAEMAGFGRDDLPERVVLEGGRPVLVVPRAGHYTTIGERVLVAWNGKRESTRAIFDALPMLKAAADVKVLAVETGRSGEGIDFPGAEIAAALARHGVKVEAARTVLESGASIGDELLNRLSDEGRDLLVMGCYGHSRMHEFVFGGVTRDILANMTAPVLLSH